MRLAVAIAASLGLTAHAQAACQKGFTLWSGACYKSQTSKLTWDAAEKACQASGAHLASIHSPKEWSYVQTFFGKSTIWIGLKHTGTTTSDFKFSWSDKSSRTTYATSADAKARHVTGPTNPWVAPALMYTKGHCIYSGGWWDDGKCTTLYPSVCKQKSPPPPPAPKPLPPIPCSIGCNCVPPMPKTCWTGKNFGGT
eukprot:COSAG01_NODE_4304_length_5158_cov_3.753509_2_plen_197_part_00